MVCYVAVVKLATVFRCKCQIKEQDVRCCVAVVNCHATYNTLLFNLTFASEHVLC